MENNPPHAPGFPPPFPKPPSFAPPSGLAAPKLPAVGGAKPLILPRRASPLLRAQEAAAATTAVTVEARKSIDAILAQSRTPWGGDASKLSGAQVDELQKAIRTMEAKLSERDLAVSEAQTRLAERERELAEAEALLAARARVVETGRRQASAANPPVSSEQFEALRKLKEELDRQEAGLKEQREALREREEFLEQSEAKLFAKMQEQQEKETELEQLADDLKRKARQLGLGGDEPAEIREKA